MGETGRKELRTLFLHARALCARCSTSIHTARTPCRLWVTVTETKSSSSAWMVGGISTCPRTTLARVAGAHAGRNLWSPARIYLQVVPPQPRCCLLMTDHPPPAVAVTVAPRPAPAAASSIIAAPLPPPLLLSWRLSCRNRLTPLLVGLPQLVWRQAAAGSPLSAALFVPSCQEISVFISKFSAGARSKNHWCVCSPQAKAPLPRTEQR